MNSVIDINDVSTYPVELLNLFNSYTEVNPDTVLSNYDFKCCHVFCTSDIDNYYKLGIMRPFKVSGDSAEVNVVLKDIILKPISERDNYNEYAGRYDKLLLDEYEENKDIIDDWYGKYSCVCYTLDDLSKITVDNPAYEPIINCYGGELFRDLGFSDKEAEEIAAGCKAYVIFFRLSYDEIKKKIYTGKLVEYMKSMYIDGKSDYGFEGSINKDISSDDFIDVKELSVSE